MTRTYWRSRAQLENAPESREFIEREFPEGASELPEGITRRQMMTLVGASLSIAGLAACRRPVEQIVPYVNAPEDVVPGIPRYYATTMPFLRSAYGIIVESHEGRPTKIEGNPKHPSTMGASSVRVQAATVNLYDPDRSQTPRLKGDTRSWNDFVTAWAEIAKAHAGDGGAGLAILSESFSSPTLARLASDFRSRYPRARWATSEPVSDEARLAGHRSATGRDLETMLHVDRAKVILALDADVLSSDPEMIRHARGFADGRRAGASGGTMNRLYAVEAIYSLTGAMADHRLRLPSGQIASFVAALASRIATAGLTLGPGGATLANAEIPAGIDRRWVEAIAKDLAAHRGESLIVAGDRQPAAVHAAVFALNAALGNAGRTVSYHEAKDSALPDRESLATLVAAMNAGTVSTLVILGGNPVYDAPADLAFGAAMAKVPRSIALGHHLDETSANATWHVPRAHFLESWADARALGGTLSIVQPLILPLFNGKSSIELLNLVATGKDRPGYDVVKETWKPILGEADFEKKWNHVLNDGLLAGSELPEITPAITGQPFAGLAGAAAETEVVFVPSSSVFDGRFANDGWLQELPDPLTKMTWDNPALVSPKTASALGVESGDVVRIDLAGRSAELPIWVLPGMADGTVAVTLGYGRTRAGRIGSGVGFDAYRLRVSKAPGFEAGARLTKTGRRYAMSVTQEHGSMEGRPIIRETTLAELAGKAGEGGSPAKPLYGTLGIYEEKAPPLFSLWKEHAYDTGHQWGMTIDLNACIGCNACMVACQSENNVPVVGKAQVAKWREMHWLRVDRYFTGDPSGTPEAVFQPVPCMQCENAPCEQVCPVGATVHDQQGLNVMVYNRCIGTRYCSNNCPYKVRHFNFFNFTKDTPEVLRLAMNPDVTVRARGVMEKCTYCVQRINRTRIEARLAGREMIDGDVKTACQQACPASAIEFGDLRDGGSRVAKAKRDPRNYALLEELNVRPRTTYLAKVRNPNPDLESGRPEA